MCIILGFPGVIGCLDGTEVIMMKLSINPEMYLNRKNDYDFNLLPVFNSSLFRVTWITP